VKLVSVAVVLTSAVSAFVPGVPVSTVAVMAAAGLVALVATRTHDRADLLRLGGAADATPMLRAARFLDDLALALSLLALLFALPLR
jgi:hypothetical protein